MSQPDPATHRNDSVPPCYRRVRAGAGMVPQPIPFPSDPATQADTGRADAHDLHAQHEAAREALIRQPASNRPYPSMPRRRQGLSPSGRAVATVLVLFVALVVFAPLTLHLVLSARP